MSETSLPDKVKLYLPIEFWSEIMIHLDKKAEMLAQEYGYGRINLSLAIHEGKVKDVIFTDEIRIRGIVEKTGRKGDPRSVQHS